MTIACQMVSIAEPAPPPLPNITAISMVPSCTNCIGTPFVSITVDVTWENQGIGTGSFYPGVIWSSGGIPVGGATSPTQISLDSGKRFTFTFSIELIEGTYEICPDPN